MGNCHFIVLCSLLVVFALLSSRVHSVQILENGTITAKGKQILDGTVFNKVLKPNSLVEFEVKSNPGMFLLLKEITILKNTTPSSPINATDNSHNHYITYALRVDLLSSSNLTRWEISGEERGVLLEY